MTETTISDQYGSQPVTAGEVNLILANNAWGYGASYDGQQEIENHNGYANFSVTKSLAYSTKVMGYPNLWAGCRLGGTTEGPDTADSWMPIPLGSLPHVSGTFQTGQSAKDGSVWDTTFDCWVCSPSTWPKRTRVAEVMVLLTYPRIPAGAQEITLAGTVYYLTQREVSNTAGLVWNLVQFRLAEPRASVTELNLTQFFDYVMQRGWAAADDLLIQVSAGFELWVGGETLSVDWFTVEVPWQSGSSKLAGKLPLSGYFGLPVRRGRACQMVGGPACVISDGRGRLPEARPLFECPSAGQACLVEPIQQAGLALVLCAQFQEPLGERGRVVLPIGECFQVPQQRHGQVVVARPFRLDQRCGLLPGCLRPGSELVEVPGVGGGPGGRLASRFLASASFLGLLPRGLADAGRLPQLSGRPGRCNRLCTTSRPEAAQ